MEKKIVHNWSDAWLLLAIIYSGREGGNLERIIAAGDGINHAIFNPDELESGFARLTSAGYIKEKKGIFSATNKVLRARRKTKSGRRYIQTDLEEVRKLIGAVDANEVAGPNNLKYVGFSAAAYDEAVTQYLEGFNKKK